MQKYLVCAAIVLLALAGCVSNPVERSYKGPDAGALVFSAESIGEPIQLVRFQFFYRKVVDSSGRGGGISNSSGTLDGPDTDFIGHETGQVTVRYLEPGNYDVYAYKIYGAITGATVTWDSERQFSIPFSVSQGKTTYIGDFAGIELTRDDVLGLPYTSGAILVVSDKHDRDLAFAQKHDPGLFPVTIAVSDVSRLGDPCLRSREPSNSELLHNHHHAILNLASECSAAE